MNATPDERKTSTMGPRAMIRLTDVRKEYGSGEVAVEKLSFDVAEGEVCVLVGPSGCGKTTTLKMINRLIEPTSGHIFLDGHDITRADPVLLRRRMGYVIQHVGLFPHQTVADNVATVPRLLGWSKLRRRQRTNELLDLVGLAPKDFAKRYPHQLSGGQQQRVGVARALAADPVVLLMDEPFSAIDPIARDRLQVEFLRLQEEVRKTVVFVTHDIEEAIRLGDRIAVLSQGGVLEQYADPATLLGSPATDFVADFVGADRGLKRLAVTPIELTDLERPPTVRLSDTAEQVRHATARNEGTGFAVVVDDDGHLRGWVPSTLEGKEKVERSVHRMAAWVPATASLKQAFAVMLQEDAGWVAVLDDDSRFLGVLTPDSLHTALRRSTQRAGSHSVGSL